MKIELFSYDCERKWTINVEVEDKNKKKITAFMFTSLF